ncbi:CpsD/CapB family tyrosine-protein kinase [Candidatus Enterococcus murrayae]|uniref:Tyrosine-protein kinase CpsD n=1 Tax=Candidatus Enterococcus murrayae TaxID=2815321 RepID=A0ABS3HF11_9ENTE|nr:CpsD/CapB family tyrosine-protein kinase [Enterococcus sp. MJM16]MBO0452046.1 CpsD/CapB family tyrosine-protein kinase [Enterococcus sp. MJM16]
MAKKRQAITPVDLITAINPFSTAAEQYRKIRTNIEFSSADKKIKSLVVTSSGPSEGKTTTASNLAVVFANAGSRVVLVDADLRKPNIALSFKVPNVNGLSNYLTEGNTATGSFLSEPEMENVFLTQGNTQVGSRLIETNIENLYLMPSGPTPPNPSELLSSRRMQELVDTLSESFDLVIFDMPPVVTVTDAQIMSSYVDGTILVVRERKTNKQAILEAKKLLDMVQAKIIGVVYNGKKQGEDSYYYYGTEGSK